MQNENTVHFRQCYHFTTIKVDYKPMVSSKLNMIKMRISDAQSYALHHTLCFTDYFYLNDDCIERNVNLLDIRFAHLNNIQVTKGVRYAHSYVMNGSFEHTDDCWIRDGDAQIVDLYLTTNGIEQAKNGHAIMRLKCRKAEASTVYQEINDIPDGKYKLTAYVKVAGEGLEACMYIRTSEIEYRTDIENTENYTRITVKNIVVSGGKCTIGFSASGPEDSVVYIDQVVFEKTS